MNKSAEPRRRIPVDLSDVLGLAGGGLISYGAHLIYEPAGFIVSGVFCVAGAVFSAVAKAR